MTIICNLVIWPLYDKDKIEGQTFSFNKSITLTVWELQTFLYKAIGQLTEQQLDGQIKLCPLITSL